MKKIIFILIVCLILVFGCTQTETNDGNTIDNVETNSSDAVDSEINDSENDVGESTGDSAEVTDTSDELPVWMTTVVKDVKTGEEFSIADFKGKKVMVETFAVWCPTCLAQQKEMEKVDGALVMHVSVDVDPSEDEARVLGHIEKNGFEWPFVVAPVEMSRSLVDEFGINVVNAPSAPVILICENQERRLLGFGVKSAESLQSELEKGC